jgi:hypothetical protein
VRSLDSYRQMAVLENPWKTFPEQVEGLFHFFDPGEIVSASSSRAAIDGLKTPHPKDIAISSIW